SVVFTSADLPLRRVVTVGPSVGPIFPTTSTVPFVTPNPPAPVREKGIPDHQKVHCHNYYSANHFPCEEKRVRKFIQRRRERELEQVARQRAIEERRAREAKEREEKERGRRESKREEKDPKERRERGRKERAEKKKQNLHGKVKFMLPIRKEKEEPVAEREERRGKERCERLQIAEAAKKKQEEEEIERMRMESIFSTKFSIVVSGKSRAVLNRVKEKVERPIIFIIRRTSKAEMNYHSNALECLALVWALDKLKPYVYGRNFTVFTDNSALKWLYSKKDIDGKYARWILALQEFQIQIKHIKGHLNVVADTLSRFPVGDPEETDLPEAMCCAAVGSFHPPEEIALLQHDDKATRLIRMQLREDGAAANESYALKKDVRYRKKSGWKETSTGGLFIS
ncbi:Uncharacterized protein APZ42_033650, partial [Daphnia magna]